MADVNDVASYMLKRRAMTAMKLQKLVYYAQAWHLVRRGTPLFSDPIEAWANGPVVRTLYDGHRGQFGLSSWPEGDADRLDPEEAKTIDRVLDLYGNLDAQSLSEQTHSEQPWKAARDGLPEGARSSAEIDPDVMRRFYTSASGGMG